MTCTIHQIRCLIAETFLGLALSATPKGSNEELAMCYAVAKYQDTLREQGSDIVQLGEKS